MSDHTAVETGFFKTTIQVLTSLVESRTKWHSNSNLEYSSSLVLASSPFSSFLGLNILCPGIIPMTTWNHTVPPPKVFPGLPPWWYDCLITCCGRPWPLWGQTLACFAFCLAHHECLVVLNEWSQRGVSWEQNALSNKVYVCIGGLGADFQN